MRTYLVFPRKPFFSERESVSSIPLGKYGAILESRDCVMDEVRKGVGARDYS